MIMEKIWLRHYDRGVPETINPDEVSNLCELLANSVQEFSRKTAFSSFGSKLSYHSLDKHSLHMATYFQQGLGLKKGDRIAIMLPNVLQYPVAVFAALRAGLVVVNVNPLYTVPETVHQLNDADVKAILVFANFAHVIAKAKPYLNAEHVIVTEVGDLMHDLKGKALNFIVKYVQRSVPKWHISGAVNFNKALTIGKKMQFIRVPVHESDVAFLQYTGGTTGVAKGAVLTHRNMVANTLQAVSFLKGPLEPGKELLLGALPLYHILALMVCGFVSIRMGAHTLLIANPRKIDHLIKTLHKLPITIFLGLNTLLNALLEHKNFNRINFKKLKLTFAGGMPTKQVVAHRWQDRTGSVVLDAYGLTEASPAVSISPVSQREFTGGVGLPLPSTDISIRDDEGNEVAIGEQGELWVKGPQVMREYWRNPEETAKVLTADGWLRTGDVFSINENGVLFVSDRLKDMINVSGFKVYPTELEDVIMNIDGVSEAAAVGVPCEQTGEAIKVFVVRKTDSLSEEDILTHCRESLTSYKIPRFIEFRDELPKTNVGKVLRRELRDAETAQAE